MPVANPIRLPRAGPARVLGALLVALTGGSSGASGADQTPAIAGSESFTAIALEVGALGGGATSTSFSAEVGAGALFGGFLATSANHEARGGVVWSGTSIGGAPLVFGAVPGFGVKEGGTPTRVIGFNLAAPGASTPQVWFNGRPAPLAGALQNTYVDVVTPPGKDVFGNPEHPVAIALLNAKGFAAAADSYLYLPSLTQAGKAVVGGQLLLQVRSPFPQSFLVLAIGKAIPGVALPLPGVDGALAVLTPPILLPPQLLLGAAADLPLPIPASPALAGASGDLQGILLTALAPPAGAFTNPLTVVVDG